MKKTIQKEIIFIPLIIILVSIGLLLFAKTSRADCYVLYSYTDPTFQRHPPIPCLSELPKGFTDNYADSGYEYYRFFKMSNCHCKANPVANDYYEFDNVCSFDVLYWPSNQTEKNVPLFYNQCSACPASQHTQISELILSCPTWGCYGDYIPKSILTAPSDYVSKSLGITPEEYFNRIASWKEASCVQTKGPELVKPYLEDDEYEETTYTTCAYTPCQVLPTCQEKCLKERPLPEGMSGSSGSCLSNPEPENGFPKSLKQEGQYDDCLRGQSCHCYNTKPYVESVSLSVDPTYKDKFENYDDGRITEYDPLICQVSIYDADKTDQTEGKIRAVILPLANGTRIVGALGAASCRFDSVTKKHICTKKFKPEEIKVEGGVRGKKLSCEAIPYDAYQEGITGISNEFIVAQFNYYFVHLNPPEVGNYKYQYNLFTDLSVINNTDEDAGKPLYLKQRCLFKKEDFQEYAKNLFLARPFEEITLTEIINEPSFGPPILSKIDDCLKSMDLEWNPKKDRIIGMSGIRWGGFTTWSEEEFSEDTVFISEYPPYAVAHELGHSYGLCDEYSWEDYKNSNSLRLCHNDYPSCCIDKRLDDEAEKIFRDGKNFYDWYFIENKEKFTEEELLQLRVESPCAKIGGECLYGRFASEEINEPPPPGYILIKKDSWSHFCPRQKKEYPVFPGGCYIQEAKATVYGNNCYHPLIIGDFEEGRCAGMPLSKMDNVFVEGGDNIYLSYRSIMGYGRGMLDILRYPSKAKYPLNPK